MHEIIQGSKETTWWGCKENRALLEGNWHNGHIYLTSWQWHQVIGGCWFLAVIGFQRKIRMIQIRHLLDQVFVCHIWYVQLFVTQNSRQIYPSDLLKVSTLHSGKYCIIPFLSWSYQYKWIPFGIILAHRYQLSCVNWLKITADHWHWLKLWT